MEEQDHDGLRHHEAAAESSVPLLEKKAGGLLYVEGCPGCAIDRRKAENPGIPYSSFLYVWVITLSTDKRLACCKKNRRYWVLCWVCRCFFYVRKIFDGNYLGNSSRPYWEEASYSVQRFLRCHLLDGDSYKVSHGCIEWLTRTNKVCRPEHEALALSLVSTSWAIGLIIGPALGGYLALPAEKYPNIFSPDSFFGRFPYFLPCLCTSVFAAVVLIGCLWMPETLHKHKASENGKQSVEAVEAHLIDPQEKVEESASVDTKKSLFKNWPLMSSIIVYCIFSYHDMAYTEVFSLWAESDKKYGGLGLSSEDVGQTLGITGGSLLVYQMFIYPRINKVLGPIKCCQIAAVSKTCYCLISEVLLSSDCIS
uniref:Major facilitator superfamily (MFS) profile domain-containing protein n=1 Tax=Aegilops tauschii subsp. strangulata TaxID=200361 RepID=A0A453HIF7_AEGTS